MGIISTKNSTKANTLPSIEMRISFVNLGENIPQLIRMPKEK